MTTNEFNDRLVAELVANISKHDEPLGTMICVIYKRLKSCENELERLCDVVSEDECEKIEKVLDQ